MTIGASLLLIAVGAVLRFAVTATLTGVDLPTIGVILMVIGALGLVLGLVLMTRRRRTDILHTDTDTDAGVVAPQRTVRRQTTYVEPAPLDPTDPRY